MENHQSKRQHCGKDVFRVKHMSVAVILPETALYR